VGARGSCGASTAMPDASRAGSPRAAGGFAGGSTGEAAGVTPSGTAWLKFISPSQGMFPIGAGVLVAHNVRRTHLQ
jgi:hypothetical protein